LRGNGTATGTGDGPQRQELEAHFEGTNTVFMGMMNGQELSEAYASGDVFVMPSESETLGFVVLEAMASRMPVVSVAAGGLTDIITEHGKMGLLYAPGDYAAANAHLAKLLDDAEYRDRIAQGGFDEVSRWNTHASNVWLREQQYTGAMRRFRLRERFKGLLLWVSIHAWVRALLRMLGLGRKEPSAAPAAT
jgi:sulfoquinovosyltransferase